MQKPELVQGSLGNPSSDESAAPGLILSGVTDYHPPLRDDWLQQLRTYRLTTYLSRRELALQPGQLLPASLTKLWLNTLCRRLDTIAAVEATSQSNVQHPYSRDKAATPNCGCGDAAFM
jgi:hypothetical protein